MNKKEFTEMVQKATKITDDESHPFLYADTTIPEKHRFRRNLTDVLEIPDNMIEQRQMAKMPASKKRKQPYEPIDKTAVQK